MENMNTDTKKTSWYIEEQPMAPLPIDASGRRAESAVTGLAIVGFIALVAAGMWLAVYATRFVPSVVNGVGEAAVYVGSLFTPTPKPDLSIIPTATTTISFGAATTTATSTSATSTAMYPAATVGEETDSTSQVRSTIRPKLFGLPDLAITVRAVGYLTNNSTDSFVASSTVPVGDRPAIQFTVENIGTNVTGAWRFSATVPTRTAFTYQSDPQQSLNPGDSIDYTLGFNRANIGSDQTILLIANFDNAILDSNPNNNSISAQITVL